MKYNMTSKDRRTTSIYQAHRPLLAYPLSLSPSYQSTIIMQLISSRCQQYRFMTIIDKVHSPFINYLSADPAN